MKRLYVLLPIVATLGAVGTVMLTHPEKLIVKDTSANAQTSSSTVELEKHSQQNAEYAKQAKGLAQQSRFAEASALIDKIETQNPQDVLAIVQVKDHLAREIFNRATDKYKQGDVESAISIAAKIPVNTGAFNQYQELKRKWVENQTLLTLATDLVEQKRGAAAKTALEKIEDPDLERTQRVQSLKTKIQRLEDGMQLQSMHNF